MRALFDPVEETVIPTTTEFIEALIAHASDSGEEFHIDKTGTVRVGKAICGRVRRPRGKARTENASGSAASDTNAMHFDGERWTLQYDGGE
jgi:hypothetical protein